LGELVKPAVIPSPTPELSRSMGSAELTAHRAKIAFDVKTVLSAYFQPHEAEEVKAAQLAWWCDELQDWTQEQVLWALRKWNRDFPDKRPTPGHILAICKDARGRKIAAAMPAARNSPKVERCTAEAAREILRRAGLDGKYGVSAE
jgi:hypothetical protein